MPHNDYTAREKWVNFSRRFDRNNADSYFPRRPSTMQQQPDPSDIATSSGDDTATTNSSPFSPPSNKYLSNNGADAYATPSPSDANTSTTDPSSATSSALSPQYALRPPLAHRANSRALSIPINTPLSSRSDFLLPDLPWLCGTWHVVSSSLPMWRNKRNVRITYTRLPGNRLDDHVTYQTMDSDQVVSVRGVDSSKRDGSYVWRGQGFLKVASSRWEVLGWGGGGQGATPAGRAITSPATTTEGANTNPTDPAATAINEAANAQSTEFAEQWVVTYFARTLFTPGGIDIYSRKASGLSPRTMKKLRTALTRVGATGKGGGRSVFGGPSQQAEFQKIAGDLFEVKRDGSRRDGVDFRKLGEEELDKLVGA